MVGSGYSFTGIALDMCSSYVLAAAAVDSEIAGIALVLGASYVLYKTRIPLIIVLS